MLGGALETVEALPLTADSIGEAAGSVGGQIELACTWCRSFYTYARPSRGESVLVEMLRQLGDGGRDGMDTVRGGVVATAINRRRFARRSGRDSVIHRIWIVEGALAGSACEGKVVEHGARMPNIKRGSLLCCFGARWPGRVYQVDGTNGA